MHHNNEKEAIVVGGGPAGLAAAAYLAREGKAVTVFERSQALGGRASTRTVEGFRLNRGIHALYSGGAATTVLADLGVTYTAGTPKLVGVLDGNAIRRFPSGPASLLTSSWLSVRDKIELAKVLGGLPRTDAARLSGVSAEAWIHASASRPAVRRLLTAAARPLVYSSTLDRVSADVLVDKLQRAAKHPVHYVDGGWQTLVDGLREAAVGAGASIELGSEVLSISRTNGRASGVQLRSGRRAAADAVVVALPPRAALRVIGDGDAAFASAVEALRPAMLACLDVALRRLPRPDRPVVQGLDGPVFMTTQSLYSAVAPHGMALVYSFKQLDPDDPGDPRAHQRDLEGLLDAVQPGWRDALVERQYLPRIEASGAVPAPDSGGMAGRPPVDAAALAGLALAGDWVGPEGFLLDASLASARAAARHLLRDRRQDREAQAGVRSAVAR